MTGAVFIGRQAIGRVVQCAPGHWPTTLDLGATASPSLEPEPQRRDAEKRKEPNDIRHRGDEYARRDRRVGVEAMEPERHQNAAERPCQEIADHGETDHHAEVGHLEPRRRRDTGDNREGQAIDQGYRASARTATVIVWVAALPP